MSGDTQSLFPTLFAEWTDVQHQEGEASARLTETHELDRIIARRVRIEAMVFEATGAAARIAELEVAVNRYKKQARDEADATDRLTIERDKLIARIAELEAKLKVMSEMLLGCGKQLAEARSANQKVWCVLCVNGTPSGIVHIFSTEEKRNIFLEKDQRNHVVYDYIIDFPERMETMLS